MKRYITRITTAVLMALSLQFAASSDINACTGITLKTAQGAPVLGRTVEWGGDKMTSTYVTVPRGYIQQSYLPGLVKGGMTFKARYGYVGLSVEMPEFVIEGMNEKGLSAGLFYFPHYGQYEEYKEENNKTNLSDMQFVSWVLGSFATIDEVKANLYKVHVCTVDPRASTVHWRIADKSGKQIVVEIVKGRVEVYDNPLGVLTNSPEFPWQMTNLSNYVNLKAGTAASHDIGGVRLASFGTGSAHLGLPGDITPPSRFVRAAFYQTTAPVPENAKEAVLSSFHILNNFDIPIGAEFADAQIPEKIPSATQWTSVSDIHGLKIYFRTMYNSNIRMIDLGKINFSKVKYSAKPMDEILDEPIIELN